MPNTVTLAHPCGHASTITPSPVLDLEWLESKPCRDCWLAKRQARDAAAIRKANRLVKAGRLPALTGTPAQIRWAEVVRSRMLTALDRLSRESQGRTRRQRAATTYDWAIRRTDASFWIGLSSKTTTDLMALRHRQSCQQYAQLVRPEMVA